MFLETRKQPYYTPSRQKQCLINFSKHDEQLIRFPGLLIDEQRHEIRINENAVDLTYTEFGILVLFAKKTGRVFTRGQIIELVRRGDYPVTDRSVDVRIVV